jgi:hypothetical protein
MKKIPDGLPKPKRYPSAKRLATTWQEESLEGEAFASISSSVGYIITADRETIWNGYKSQVLVQRNRPLGLVIALRESSASLGKVALATIQRALIVPEELGMRRVAMGIFENTVRRSYASCPYVRVDSLADPALATCDLETLGPLVLQSSVRTLEFLVAWCNRYPRKGMAALEFHWEEEALALGRVGLTLPVELVEKYAVLKVARRLLNS